MPVTFAPGLFAFATALFASVTSIFSSVTGLTVCNIGCGSNLRATARRSAHPGYPPAPGLFAFVTGLFASVSGLFSSVTGLTVSRSGAAVPFARQHGRQRVLDIDQRLRRIAEHLDATRKLRTRHENYYTATQITTQFDDTSVICVVISSNLCGKFHCQKRCAGERVQDVDQRLRRIAENLDVTGT